VGEGKPGWSASIGCITLLIVLKSCKSLHLPNFFLITKIGVLQGLWVDSICPAFNCSSTRSVAAANFSPVKGHWSTQTGSVESQVTWAACLKGECLICWTRAPTENAAWPDILALSFLDSLKAVQHVTYLVDVFPILYMFQPCWNIWWETMILGPQSIIPIPCNISLSHRLTRRLSKT
jgi:hypothetical protein